MIVQSSWKVSDDRPISDAVVSTAQSERLKKQRAAVNLTSTLQTSYTCFLHVYLDQRLPIQGSQATCSSRSHFCADLEDEIMVENCVMLEAPEKGEGLYPTVPACQLLISCEPPNQISRISVLCEARVIEVYGHHGEYLKTVKNVLLEEAEDMVVFRGDIVLDVPVSLCSIKFVLLRSLSEMWLYGVKVHTVKAAFEEQSQMTVPLAAVEQRLGQMGLALSDKAEAFKQLVQCCQKSSVMDQGMGDIMSNLLISNLIKNKSPSPESDLAGMLKNISGHLEKRDSQNNIKDDVPQLGASFDPPKTPIHTTSAATSPVMFQSISTSTQTEEEYVDLETKLKAIVIEQIEEVDKKIWAKLNQRFQETEAKIMCKLEEIESFVKPQGVQAN